MGITRQYIVRLLALIVFVGSILSLLAMMTTSRLDACLPVPFIASNLLPNASLATPGVVPSLPDGWQAGAPGVAYGTFALDGDERSLHLMGIANYVQTPPIAVTPAQRYCFVAHAITDSSLASPTRVQVHFRWLANDGTLLHDDSTTWQPVVLWQANNPPAAWSRIAAAFTAPVNAHTLTIRIHPASDDRIYLDVFHVQRGGAAVANEEPTMSQSPPSPITLAPFPNNKQAAVSFSFDWETAMAGLIHSRSVGDPYSNTDPILRGIRMREGITNTIALFRPHAMHATYYAAGYSLLLSNTHQIAFMGNPTYQWANAAHRWQNDYWQTTPWFAPDPHGTTQSHPAWYGGDLVALLQAAGHDIQSHSFTHFYAGFVDADEWRTDMHTWNEVAAWRDVPPARSLAFPWSSSGGMSDANWEVVRDNGITSVTRLSDQSQYNLFPTDANGIVQEPHCVPLPGHETILACPDVYLTPASVERVIRQIERARTTGGTIDVWSHTEEVVTQEQRAAWQRVVDYVAAHKDIWVAPLHVIADWQHALANITIASYHTMHAHERQEHITMTNHNQQAIDGVTLRGTQQARRILIDGNEYTPQHHSQHPLIISMAAGQTCEVTLWLPE